MLRYPLIAGLFLALSTPALAQSGAAATLRQLAYPGATVHIPRVLHSPAEEKRAAALKQALPATRDGYRAYSTRDGFQKVLGHYQALAGKLHLEPLVDEPIDDGRGRLLIFLSTRPNRVITVHLYPAYRPGSRLFAGAEPSAWQRLILIEVR